MLGSNKQIDTHSLIITGTKVLVHCALGAMVVVAWLDKHNLRMLN